MNFSLYIAKRYLFSRKSRNAINIISAISILGVATGTAALIIVLSVFNGFDGLLKKLYSSFDPDIKITSEKSKTFVPDTQYLKDLESLYFVDAYSLTIEENALLEYDDQQIIASMKGVDSNFSYVTGLDTMLIDGEFTLEYYDSPVAILGRAIAGRLNIGLDMLMPMKIHIPSRTAEVKGNFQDVQSIINTGNIYPIGVFSIQQDYDEKYIIVPLKFAQNILEYNNNISAIEVKINNTENLSKVKTQIKNIFGESFKVADRQEQHEFLYKVLKSEKWAIFMIMVFIVLIASFNIVGSLTMLIIDKKKDISILQSLGAETKTVRRVFFMQGMFISLIGTLTGLLLGGIICYIQQTYDIISLGKGGSYIINAYPVLMKGLDFIAVFGAVMLIGFLASWFPVKYLTSKFTKNEFN